MKLSILFILIIIISINCYAEISFPILYGSDLLLGMGAASVAKSGAVVANINSPEALYWNPAGVGHIDNFTVNIYGNHNSAFSDLIIVIPGKRVSYMPNPLTISAGFITRLRFQADSKEEIWIGFAHHILDMSMLSISDNFSGSVDSRTVEYRIGANWNFSNLPLRAGIQFCHLH